MQGRYPRTVAEFAAHQRVVIVSCADCNRNRYVPYDVLEAIYGPDFDLYAGYAALRHDLRCDGCGQKYRDILLENATPLVIEEKPVSFEEALNRDLERRAARRLLNEVAGKPEPVQKIRRRRR